MTQIQFDVNGSEYNISIVGHANYGPHGSDIVCACVSMLTELMRQILIDSDIKYSGGTGNGEAYYSFNTAAAGGYVDSKLLAILRGYEMIANQYPNNVSLRTMMR